MADHDEPAILKAELRARAERARDPLDEAIWRLLAGDADAGLATIRRGVFELRSLAPASVHLAQVALLADDPTAAALAAAAVDEALARYVPGNREYHATVLALIAGDEELARRHQAALDAFVASHDRFRGGQPGRIADITGGLLDRDADRVATGMATLLAWHLRRARARSDIFNSSRGVISLDAIVALLVALRRGLNIPVDQAYRMAQVPLLVLHVAEWQGRPLPRAMPIDVITDLVAGPWLLAHGLRPEPAPSIAAKRPLTHKRAPGSRAATQPIDQVAARRALEARLALGGHPWQLASWALILGNASAARAHLQAAATESRRRWQASASQEDGPNANVVREHFALALVLGDESSLRETIQAMHTWLRTQSGRPWFPYAHADGYLDLICDLVGGGERSRPSRAEVEQVMGPLSSTRVAAIALAVRETARLREGLESMLMEHTKMLERKSSPPPPICAPAVHLAAAARRLAVPVTVDERFSTWPVPLAGARLPCDLLGRALWSGLG